MARKLPIFYSALMLTGVNLLLRFFGTGFQVYLSGRIGAENIGLLQLVMSVGSMAMVAGMGGIRTATMYLTAGELGTGRKGRVIWVLSGCIRYSLIFSGCISLLLQLFAPQIAAIWIGDGRVVAALRLYGAFLPCVCLCGVMTGYFTAANRIGTLAAVEVGEQLLSMVLTLTLLQLWAGSDPIRACLSVILGSGLGACLTLSCLIWLRIREGAPTGPRIAVTTDLRRTALPLAVADDLRNGISTAENLMVPKRLALCHWVENPLAQFGTVSGMVFPVLMFPACILYGLAELLIPELARCAASGSTLRIRYLVRRSLKVALLYGLMFGGLLYLLGIPLCQTLYASREAGNQLRLYALLVPMLYCDAITDAMIKGLGQQKISVRYNIFTNVLDLIFLFFLLPEYGMQGYFISFFITHLINFLLSLRRLLRITGQTLPLRAGCFALGAWVAGILMVGLAPAPIFRLVAYPLLLGALLTLTGVSGKADLRWFRGLIKSA